MNYNIESNFITAYNIYQNIKKNINKQTTFQLYAYFKQANEGNICFEKPSLLNMDGRNKWIQWKKIENMPSEEAKIKYIQLVYKLTNHPNIDMNEL